MRKKLLTLAIVFYSISVLWSTEVKITASDAGSSDYFGYSVSISGNYAIVGAYQEDAEGSDAGAAYIFIRNGANWSEQQKITATDATNGDRFGYSVSISGDYAVVGAYYENAGGTGAGAAYIFHRSGETWTQQQKLTPSDAAVNDYFGWSVSINGDYVMIGTPGKNSAYVFHRSDVTWTQQAKLIADDAEAFQFGCSISISGDYVIVGAERTDYNDPGAAYIFHRSDVTWTKQAKLVASDRQNGDYFGNAVSISGNYAIVGAFYEDDGGTDAGAAYIFNRSDVTWAQQQKITASNAEAGDFFGTSVSISGDYAIVGAQREETGGTDAGAAYSYLLTGNTWSEKSLITASDAGDSQYFGYSVYISGDYALVGAYNNNAAYIYETTSDLSLPVELSSFTAEQNNSSVALHWVTESEIENLGFIIERKLQNQKSYQELSSFTSHEALKGQGSTTQIAEYNFIDKAVEVGQTYIYRLSDVDYHGKRTDHAEISIVVKASDTKMLADRFRVKSCYPNPFNPSITIIYEITDAMIVTLHIFDVQGREVYKKVSDPQLPGTYELHWNGRDANGVAINSGIYIARLEAGAGYSQSLKLIYLQ